MATLERMTAERYHAVTVEGDRTQLVDGRIVVDEPKTIHGVLQLRLGAAVYDWIQTGTGRGLASMPTGVEMDEYNVYGPDVLWFREERIPAAWHWRHARLAHAPGLRAAARRPVR